MADVTVGMISEIPLGEGRNFDVSNQRVAIFRPRNGGVYAVQAECPHRGGPLADGLLGGTTLICPLHSWKFDLATGEVLFGTCGLRTFPVCVTGDGHVVVTI